jgi:mevalonate kinase
MSVKKNKIVTASAPAKVILFGEHFVVYGHPAIVLAIDKRASVTAQLRKDDRISISSSNLRIAGTFKGDKFQARKGGAKARLRLEPARTAVQQVLGKASSKKTGVDVHIDSDIPISTGLGSSAAVATATVAAVGHLLDVELTRDQIFRMAYESECLVHGTPSGIDPAISTYGGALQFQKKRDFIDLKVQTKVPLVIGNTKAERSTGELFARVRRVRQNYPSIVDLLMVAGARTALLAVEALRKEELKTIGELMNINHALLSAVGVSHESLDRLVYAARNNGAYGAKLTGGGGGRCIVAVAEDNKLKKVKAAIERAGGTAFEAHKSDEGVRIER